MAVSVSSASPPRVSNNAGNTATSAGFDAPADSLVVLIVWRDGPTTELPVYSNNGAALTWEVVDLLNNSDGTFNDDIGWENGSLGMAFAKVGAARTGLTVGATLSTTNQFSIKPYLLLGADTDDPLGAHIAGADPNTPTVTPGFTTQAASSILIGAAGGARITAPLNTGLPTSSDLTFDPFNLNGELGGGSGYKTLGAAGQAVTFSVTCPASATESWQWNYIGAEFKAAGTGTGPDPGTLLRSPTLGVDRMALRLSGGTGPVRVDFSLSSDMSSPTSSVGVTPDSLGNAHVPYPTLTPNTEYFFRPFRDGAYFGTVRSFTTLPGSGDNEFVFGFSSCRATDVDAAVLQHLPSRGAQMMLFIGDMHYEDINSTNAGLYRDADDEPYTQTYLGQTLTTIPNTRIYDDHDFCGDASWSGSAGAETAVQVFKERVPTPSTPGAGAYHTFKAWGDRIRVIVLDCRYYRDQIGTTSDGTMLGTEQLSWLQGLLETPDTPLTFVVSSVGWHSAGSDDDWGFYQNERSTVASWISASDTEVVFLCGDMHRMAIALPSNGTPGGVHVWHAAALNQFDNGVKGGTYEHTAPYHSPGVVGLVTLADTGSAISATFTGVRESTTDWAETDTVTVESVVVVATTRFFLAC